MERNCLRRDVKKTFRLINTSILFSFINVQQLVCIKKIICYHKDEPSAATTGKLNLLFPFENKIRERNTSTGFASTVSCNRLLHP